jgi:hypothetical protein
MGELSASGYFIGGEIKTDILGSVGRRAAVKKNQNEEQNRKFLFAIFTHRHNSSIDVIL